MMLTDIIYEKIQWIYSNEFDYVKKDTPCKRNWLRTNATTYYIIMQLLNWWRKPKSSGDTETKR